MAKTTHCWFCDGYHAIGECPLSTEELKAKQNAVGSATPPKKPVLFWFSEKEVLAETPEWKTPARMQTGEALEVWLDPPLEGWQVSVQRITKR